MLLFGDVDRHWPIVYLASFSPCLCDHDGHSTLSTWSRQDNFSACMCHVSIGLQSSNSGCPKIMMRSTHSISERAGWSSEKIFCRMVSAMRHYQISHTSLVLGRGTLQRLHTLTRSTECTACDMTHAATRLINYHQVLHLHTIHTPPPKGSPSDDPGLIYECCWFLIKH